MAMKEPIKETHRPLETTDQTEGEYGEYTILSFALLNLLVSHTDDLLICIVCDRGFTTARQLVQHQISRKHFMCASCEQKFESPDQLREHKDRENHWSDTEEEDVPEMMEKRDWGSQDEEEDDISQSFSEIERLV
jgi:transcription elongation factor Elf1